MPERNLILAAESPWSAAHMSLDGAETRDWFPAPQAVSPPSSVYEVGQRLRRPPRTCHGGATPTRYLSTPPNLPPGPSARLTCPSRTPPEPPSSELVRAQQCRTPSRSFLELNGPSPGSVGDGRRTSPLLRRPSLYPPVHAPSGAKDGGMLPGGACGRSATHLPPRRGCSRLPAALYCLRVPTLVPRAGRDARSGFFIARPDSPPGSRPQGA